MALLEVKGLKKYFPIYSGLFRRVSGAVKAVDGVDFSVGEGEAVGLVGESGSGKSTTARVSVKLLEPTGGELLYCGKSLQEMESGDLMQLRRQVQMVFQDPYLSLNPRKTAEASIGEGMLFHGIVANEKEMRERVAEILELVGLSPEVMRRYPHEFSGGQQQRICIGRAIATDPRLIICDEAVSALDISIQAQILNLFSDLKERMGLSYLFIAHDLSVVRHLCDRVVVLYLGKVMEEAPTEELFSNPKHPYTQALLSAVPKSHPDEERQYLPLQGEIPSPADPPSGCPFRTRCPYAEPRCADPPPKKDPGNGHSYFCILD